MTNRSMWPTLSLLASILAGAGCGGGKAAPGGPGPGMTGKGGSMGSKGPMGMPMGMNSGAAGAVPVGIPTSGSLSTIYPGGGVNGSTPLMPGCTPASAKECPSATGTCATSAGAGAKSVSTGYICYYATSSSTSGGGMMPGMGMTATTTTTTTTVTTTPEATVEYIHETAGGQEYYHFRITFDPTFVDNTYGENAVGWGTRGHTFNDLVGSDHAQLSLFDGSKAMISEFNLDYISQDSSAACGYSCLGVSGGEGGMLLGDSKYILAATSSLDRDLNGCGYCKNAACNGDCTVDSPATDQSYTPNTLTPSWDYRVVYEVWVSAAAFGSNGFGGASITFVHASPSKASSNTVTVEPKPCGSCPDGYTNYLTSEGAVCVPIPRTDGGSGGVCPQGYTEYLTSEGQVCLPTGSTPDGGTGTGAGGSGGSGGGGPCPTGYVNYLTSEGASCVPVATGGGGGCGNGTASYKTTTGSAACLPVPTGSGCANGYNVYYLQSEGAVCVPTATNGSCPEGFAVAESPSGAICI